VVIGRGKEYCVVVYLLHTGRVRTQLVVDEAVEAETLVSRQGLTSKAELGQHRCRRGHPHSSREDNFIHKLLHVRLAVITSPHMLGHIGVMLAVVVQQGGCLIPMRKRRC
jgi:hypothetical protein